MYKVPVVCNSGGEFYWVEYFLNFNAKIDVINNLTGYDPGGMS